LDQFAPACPVCGSPETVDLPVPNSVRAMISDGRLMPRPLRRRSCCNCGYGFHTIAPTSRDLLEIYGTKYSIGLRDVEAGHKRALAYGSQISDFLQAHLGPGRSISSLVEFGSGSGHLLNYLAEQWKCKVVTGVEPSAQLVDYSRRHAAQDAWIEESFAEAFDPQGTEYDLCVSVNVVEHAASPADFLRACRNVVSGEGIVAVICPDGELATSELLFYDHISSFTVCSMKLCAEEAGLGLAESSALTGPLRGFRIYLMRPNSEHGEISSIAGSALAKARAEFMGNWRELESSVLAAFGARPYAIFGTGEFADLLAAYSPGVVERARCFVVDKPIEEMCHGKPAVSTEAFLGGADIPLLAAVNLHSWPGLCARFGNYRRDIFHPYELAQKKEQ